MKCAILTFHNTRNCGANLQCLGLYRTIKLLDDECEILNYECDQISNTYKIKKIYEYNSIREAIKFLLKKKYDVRLQKKCELFRENYYGLSEKYDSLNIKKANEKYDAFIVGSDQVWNFCITGNDYSYLLDFVEDDKIKVAYAASSGYEGNIQEYKQIFSEKLNEFSKVSVREKQMIREFSQISKQAIDLMPDPVLLLKREEWSELANCMTTEKYIFVYTIALTPNIKKFVTELKKITKLDVIWAHMSYKRILGVKNVRDMSPQEFLGYVENAEYFITSSFHGLVFGSIFNKNLFYDLATDKKNNNSRLETYAERVGLLNRELKSCKVSIDDYSGIEYEHTNDVINELRDDAIKWLKQAVKNKTKDEIKNVR